MSTITVHSPIKVAVPRAMRWAANAFSKLLARFIMLSETRAVQRSQAERLNEAAAVRAYAQRFAGHDPRFAADLLAAADRHEINE